MANAYSFIVTHIVVFAFMASTAIAPPSVSRFSAKLPSADVSAPPLISLKGFAVDAMKPLIHCSELSPMSGRANFDFENDGVWDNGDNDKDKASIKLCVLHFTNYTTPQLDGSVSSPSAEDMENPSGKLELLHFMEPILSITKGELASESNIVGSKFKSDNVKPLHDSVGPILPVDGRDSQSFQMHLTDDLDEKIPPFKFMKLTNELSLEPLQLVQDPKSEELLHNSEESVSKVDSHKLHAFPVFLADETESGKASSESVKPKEKSESDDLSYDSRRPRSTIYSNERQSFPRHPRDRLSVESTEPGDTVNRYEPPSEPTRPRPKSDNDKQRFEPMASTFSIDIIRVQNKSVDQGSDKLPSSFESSRERWQDFYRPIEHDSQLQVRFEKYPKALTEPSRTNYVINIPGCRSSHMLQNHFAQPRNKLAMIRSIVMDRSRVPFSTQRLGQAKAHVMPMMNVSVWPAKNVLSQMSNLKPRKPDIRPFLSMLLGVSPQTNFYGAGIAGGLSQQDISSAAVTSWV